MVQSDCNEEWLWLCDYDTNQAINILMMRGQHVLEQISRRRDHLCLAVRQLYRCNTAMMNQNSFNALLSSQFAQGNIQNSSSTAMTHSTTSRLSRPRSATNLLSRVNCTNACCHKLDSALISRKAYMTAQRGNNQFHLLLASASNI